MTSWVLPAHATRTFPATPELFAAAARATDLVSVAWAGARAEVTSRGVVGSVRVDDLDIVVSARHLSLPVILGMVLGGADVRLAPIPAAEADDPDLLRVLVLALCHTTSRLFQRGLCRTYVEDVERVEMLRGEIAFDRWFGPTGPDGPVWRA